MSLLDLASLVLAPTATKEGKVYSAIPDTGEGDLSFTRATNGTRVNSAGLIEKVRTNLVTYSNDFSNAAWSKTNQGVGSVAVVTANYTTDPFGGNNAWRLQCDLNGGTTSNDRSWMLNSFSILSQSTISIYIKLNSAGTKTIVLSDSGGSTYTLSSTEWVRISATVSGGGGEYRLGLIGGLTSDTLDCSISFAQAELGDIATDYIPTTSAAVSVGMTANVPRVDYSGGGCPKLLLEPQRSNLFTFSEQFDNAAWGAQVEAGSYATSYIPTLSAASTRGQDACSKTGISSLIGQTEGTLFAEFSGIEDAIEFPNLTPTISDGSNNNRIMVYNDPSGVGAIYFRVVTSGTSIINTSILSNPNYQSINKIAIAYKNNDYAVYFNGTQIYTNTSAGAPPLCSKVDIFNDALSNNFAKVQGGQNLLFPTRLTNDELADLTTL
jgi:hypothetical protein